MVRGGQLVDGARGEPRPGDLAIDDGLITAVLDARVGWDPNLTPVSWHGVTIAIMGLKDRGLLDTRPCGAFSARHCYSLEKNLIRVYVVSKSGLSMASVMCWNAQALMRID